MSTCCPPTHTPLSCRPPRSQESRRHPYFLSTKLEIPTQASSYAPIYPRSNTIYNLSLVQNPFLSTSVRPGIFLSKAEGVSFHPPFWVNPFNHRHFRTYCFCWLEQRPSIWLSAPAFRGCLCQPLRIQLWRSGCSLGML